MTAAREILLRAADSVEKEPNRWIQRSMLALTNGELHACVTGLLSSGGEFGQTERRPDGDTVDTAILMFRERAGMPVSTWNDMEGRTPEEVAAAFRDAARSQQS